MSAAANMIKVETIVVSPHMSRHKVIPSQVTEGLNSVPNYERAEYVLNAVSRIGSGLGRAILRPRDKVVWIKKLVDVEGELAVNGFKVVGDHGYGSLVSMGLLREDKSYDAWGGERTTLVTVYLKKTGDWRPVSEEATLRGMEYELPRLLRSLQPPIPQS